MADRYAPQTITYAHVGMFKFQKRPDGLWAIPGQLTATDSALINWAKAQGYAAPKYTQELR